MTRSRSAGERPRERGVAFESDPRPEGAAIATATVALVVLSTLALGAVAPWARSALLAGVGLLTAGYCLVAVRRGRLRLAKHPSWWGVAALFALIGATLIPFEVATLGLLQPGAATLYESLGIDGDAMRALSIAPGRTVDESIRVLTLIGLFALAMHTLVNMRRIGFAVGALIVLGLFQAIYGFYAQFAGEHNIFGEPHRYASGAVTGTFLNKNHFAGLLEMIIPLAVGAVLAVSTDRDARRRMPKAWRLKIARAVSSRTFLLPVALFGACTVMTIAVMLSLSRAGVVALGVGIGVVAIASLFAFGLRRAVLVPVGLCVAAVVFGSAIGLDHFAERLGDAATGHSAQWHDRLDLSASGLDYAVDFPLLGTGLGTLGALFPRYQSGRFGDAWTDYLHNDWLQLFCEIGIVGGTLVVVTLAILLLTILGGLRRVRGRAFWLAAGATGGIVAMLVHSFFDYNLSRITSNGAVFALLLAIAYRATRLTPRNRTDHRFKVVRLGSAPSRLALSAAALIVAAGTVALAYPRARADFAANHEMARTTTDGRTEDYFLLAPSVAAGWSIDDAIASCPWSDEYRYLAARREIAQADRLVRDAAIRAARAISSDVEGDRLEALVQSLEPQLRVASYPERRPFLSTAENHLRAAIDLAPTCADYHLDLAAILAEHDRQSEPARRAMDVAYSLAPNRPRVMIAYGAHLLGRATPDETTAKTVRRCFRDAIAFDPANARDVFAVARRAYGDPDSLVAVTPETVSAYGNLVIELWREGAWPSLHRALDTLDELATDVATRAETAERRCAVFAREGDWNALRAATEEAHRLRRERLTSEVDRIATLRRAGRNPEALVQARTCLAADWTNIDVAIGAAELASLPRIARHLTPLDEPLEILLRSLLAVDAITPEHAKRIATVARLETLEEEKRGPVAELVQGIADVRAGRNERGADRLASIANVAGLGNYRHLVDLFLGHAETRRGRPSRAIAAYERVVRAVPAHLDALERLVASGRTEYADNVAGLMPRQRVNIDFGGRVRLLGYTLTSDALSCHWRVDSAFHASYRPSVHFLAADGTVIGRADHELNGATPTADDVRPRVGEVVTVRVPLDFDTTRAESMRIGMIGDDASPVGFTELTPAWGKRYVEVRPRTTAAGPAEARS